jgi:replicative DNA helicase
MELELISAVIADHRKLEEVSGIVRDRDFLDPVNRRVWRALHVLAENRVPLNDIATVAGALKAAGLTIGQIAELIGRGTAAHATYYAEQVRDAARRIRTLGRLEAEIKRLADTSVPTDSVLDAVEAVCSDERLADGSEVVKLGEAAREYVLRLQEGQRSASVYSGVPILDEKVGGFAGGETIIIAARPGVGKTSLAMQIGMHNGRKHRPGLFISLEMTRLELVGRVLCGISEVDGRDVRAGRITPETRTRLETAAAEVSELGVWIWDPAAATIGDILARARLAKLKYGIEWLVVDYIGLIDPGKETNPRLSTGNASRKLKGLAKELGVPVFILAQLNREAEKTTPTLAHLKESGDLEQDADAVLFLHEEDKQHQLIVAKHRHGERGKMAVDFDGRSTTFRGDVTSAASNVYDADVVRVNGTRWDF